MMTASGSGSALDVREYVRSDGRCPFREWIDAADVKVRARVQARIARFETGNLGDCRSLGKGIYEARFHFGAGYRIYFGIDAQTVIILLCGGTKDSQRRDISRARDFWLDYLGRAEE